MRPARLRFGRQVRRTVERIRLLRSWVHEIKDDGYRTRLALNGKTSRAFTRNGFDRTETYAPVLASARALRCRSAILDGEMCVQGANGVTSFRALRSAIKVSPANSCCSPSTS